MLTPKQKELKNFELIVQGVKEAEGTIYEMFNLAYLIRRQIERLYTMNVSNEEIQKILNKYR